MKYIAGFVFLITMVAGAYHPAAAQFGQAIWDTLTTDTLLEVVSAQALAVNGYEQFHLVYGKHRAGGGFDVCYRYFDLFNGAYPEVMAESELPALRPVICVLVYLSVFAPSAAPALNGVSVPAVVARLKSPTTLAQPLSLMTRLTTVSLAGSSLLVIVQVTSAPLTRVTEPASIVLLVTVPPVVQDHVPSV